MKRLLRLSPLGLAALLLPTAGCLKSGSSSAPGPKPAVPASTVPFSEVLTGSGIDFQQRTGKGKTLDIVQTSAGGCALFDFDGDGLLDLFLVQGQHQPGAGGGNRLYRNLGAGKWEDVTETAGVRGRGYGLGCAVGDYDGDGRPDLFVTNNGPCELYRNLGNGRFEDVTRKMGADIQGCCIGGAFADLDGDGWSDLYVIRYIKVTSYSRMHCDLKGVPVSCSPGLYEPQAGVFLHNEGGRKFVDRTQATGLVNEGRGMAAAIADYDGDGLLDMFVTNDTTANTLFRQKAKGRFENVALLAGVAYGDMGAAEANMGCDWGDVNGDGRLDAWVGVMQDRASLLFRQDAPGFFTFASRDAGLVEPTLPVVTWGGGFLDGDNDGDLDLFQANGHVHDHAAEIEPRLKYQQVRQYFENDGAGRFTDRTPGSGPVLEQAASGRGVAFGDWDNDGDEDVVVNNLDGPPTLLRNDSEKLGRHWLTVRLRGKGKNPDAEGTQVWLTLDGKSGKKQVRLAHRAYSYASAGDNRVHFGLGAATQAGPMEIRWADGSRQTVPVEGVDREIRVHQK